MYGKTMKLPPHLPIKYGSPNSSSSPPSVPSDPKTDVGHYYRSFDDRLWMFYRYWKPPASTKVVASLMIVHGTIDHSGVYEELAQHLNNVGIAVIAMDMRGWGLSDGESMYFYDLETFCQDVHHLSQLLHNNDDSGLTDLDSSKRFLLGKSIGGLITAFCAGKYYPEYWKGGFLGLSGAYQLDPEFRPSFIPNFILHRILSATPKLPFKPVFDEKHIVADQHALKDWKDDSLCCKDDIRVGYAIEILRATSLLLVSDNFQIQVPLLVMIGDDDHVVTGHQQLLEKVAKKDQQKLKVYPKGRHNLLQEPSLKNQVMGDIQSWILEHTTIQQKEKLSLSV